MAKVINNNQVKASAQWIKRYCAMLGTEQPTVDLKYMILTDELRVFNKEGLGLRRYKKPGRKKTNLNNQTKLRRK